MFSYFSIYFIKKDVKSIGLKNIPNNKIIKLPFLKKDMEKSVMALILVLLVFILGLVSIFRHRNKKLFFLF